MAQWWLKMLRWQLSYKNPRAIMVLCQEYDLLEKIIDGSVSIDKISSRF